MFCKNCGYQLLDTAVFCPNCGTKASANDATPVGFNEEDVVTKVTVNDATANINDIQISEQQNSTQNNADPSNVNQQAQYNGAQQQYQQYYQQQQPYQAPYHPQEQNYAPPSYFAGTVFQRIGWSLLSALVTVLTLGIAYPWAACMLIRWETNHTYINGRKLKFDGMGGQLLGKYLLWLLLTVITLGIYSFWFGLNLKKWIVKHTKYADDMTNTPSYFTGGIGGFIWLKIKIFLLVLFTLGIGSPWATKMDLKWQAEHTFVGNTQFHFQGSGATLFGMMLLRILLAPLTLGLYNLYYPIKFLRWQYKNTIATPCNNTTSNVD